MTIAIVGRWFTGFWKSTCDLNIVDELAAPDMLSQYSLEVSNKAKENGPRYAALTAQNAAVAVERKGQKAGGE